MILPNIGALAVFWIMCVRNTASQAYAPAPSFSYRFRINESNIELNSIVEFACGTTWNAPYPITVSVGKLESPSQTPETTEAWVTSEVIRRSDIIYFTIPVTAKYEGKIVCWYKSTRTDSKNPYSELSSPITLVVSALSHPKVTVHPNLFRKGENYTVQCDSAYNLATNFTLSLYYHILPVTPGTNWTFAGSLFLTNYTSIVLRQTNVVVPIEFACSMEMLYNGKVLHSSLSKSEQAIPEELPVRLWEQERGESCLGYLDVTLKGKWEPVCQREVDTEADSSATAATAEVACRELGCGHVLKWERLLDARRLFTQTVGGIRCIGKEKKIKDCPVEQIEDCKQRGMLYIVCSDALPRPKLSVDMYGPVSELYVKDKENVKISCSIDSAYLKSKDYGYLEFRRDGAYLSQSYSKPGNPESFTQYAPVPQGEYECVFQLTSSKMKPKSQPSNSVFIYIYNPPDPVPIIAGVLTTAVGLAILVYICIYRTTAEEVQPNEFPQTSSENPYNNASYSPQQLEAKET
ncbi:uncharacterized protein si:dkey-195m11.11 [Onychostoma macrolepis]|uniref:SRCR domain-containing protein n=1 Tax=Onychostoma macrolepis TaxID=369639 RepID=A0A7J6CZG6_9TELE|nr:uncharacterized protein si:dkey-195m11.11 [Onychostoma macrolepis]KAF4112344.1 hypothetical protein G5714_007139 [Onychostoma macrolepis]